VETAHHAEGVIEVPQRVGGRSPLVGELIAGVVGAC
jgi:hypothetical protein